MTKSWKRIQTGCVFPPLTKLVIYSLPTSTSGRTFPLSAVVSTLNNFLFCSVGGGFVVNDKTKGTKPILYTETGANSTQSTRIFSIRELTSGLCTNPGCTRRTTCPNPLLANPDRLLAMGTQDIPPSCSLREIVFWLWRGSIMYVWFLLLA